VEHRLELKMAKLHLIQILFLLKSSDSFITQLSRECKSSSLDLESTVVSNDPGGKEQKTILVLGGTGFVGSRFISLAVDSDYKIVSVSRRGRVDEKSPNYTKNVLWIRGDATDNQFLSDVFKNYGPFTACVHAIGLLLDADSGLSGLNRYASGSGSNPGEKATYDQITRATAVAAIENFEKSSSCVSKVCPFVFISAAEAGWTFKAFPEFLERYLVAKRAVENRLLNSSKSVRPVIFRPSLIWTWKRPQALLSVIPFAIGSKFLSFIDRPVLVDDLAQAMLAAIEYDDVYGVQRYFNIDKLALNRQRINKMS